MGSTRRTRSLLLGLLAWRFGVVPVPELVAALRDWNASAEGTLAALLVARGRLEPLQRRLLEDLVEVQLERHGGDLARCLAELGPLGPLLEALDGAHDATLEGLRSELRLGVTLDEGTTLPMDAGLGPAGPSEHPTAAWQPAAGPGAGWPDTGVAPDESRYRVLRPLAKGGLGEVFIALDQGLHREVALKLIQPHLARDEQSLARFLVEAEVTGRLEHPGIVPVYALGWHDDGRPYYSMRFVRGDTLKEAIDRFHAGAGFSGPLLGFRQLLARFVTVCNVVAYAHSRGVLHRDLKPANIMLGDFGETLVLDWGLAKIVGMKEPVGTNGSKSHIIAPSTGSSVEPTVLGAKFGTPQFMSPEQALGDHDRVGPASDVYSLGATLYTLLAGEPPFEGTGRQEEILERVAGGTFAPPRSVRREIPDALEKICLKAMALRPEDRYATAGALADDLEHWLADEPIASIRETRGARLSRWERRNRMLIRVGGAGLAAALLVSQLAVWRISQARRGESLALAAEQTQRQRAEQAGRRAERGEREARRLAAGLLFERGQAFGEQGDYARSLLWLARALAGAGDDPELARVVRTGLGDGVRRVNRLGAVLGDPDPSNLVAVSPDGLRIAVGDASRTIRLYDRTGALVAGPIPARGRPRALRFLPGGGPLLVGLTDGRIDRLDLVRGTFADGAIAHGAALTELEVTPDGRTLLTAGLDGRVRRWDLASGRRLEPDLELGSGVIGLAISPDGAWFLAGTESSGARLATVKSGEAIGPALEQPGRVQIVAFAPDGRLALTAGSDHAIRLWDLPAGTQSRGPIDFGTPVTAAAFSPDGAVLAVAGFHTAARLYSTTARLEIPGQPRFLAHSNYVNRLAFDPTGELLVTGSLDRTARVWDVRAGELIGNELAHATRLRQVRFTADRRSVVTLEQSGAVRLWDLSINRDLVRDEALGGPVLAVACSGDGRAYAAAGEQGVARVWASESGQPIGVPMEHGKRVWDIAFDPTGSRLLSGCESGEARLWEVATGRLRLPPLVHDGPVVAVAVSADGTLLLTGSRDRTARLWDAATGAPRGPTLEHASFVQAVAFHPGGRLLATGTEEGVVQLWSVPEGRPVGPPLRHQDAVRDLEFRPDGLVLASGSIDGLVRFWSVPSGAPAAAPLSQPGWVSDLAFDAGGRILVTGSNDRYARLWDLASGRPLGLPFPHDLAVWSLAYDPLGRWIVTGGEDGHVRLLSLPEPATGTPAELTRRARALTGLELAPDGTVEVVAPAALRQREAAPGAAPRPGP